MTQQQDMIGQCSRAGQHAMASLQARPRHTLQLEPRGQRSPDYILIDMLVVIHMAAHYIAVVMAIKYNMYLFRYVGRSDARAF